MRGNQTNSRSRSMADYPSGGWGVRVSSEALDALLAEVSARHGVTPNDITSRSVKRSIAWPRQEVMWRLRSLKGPDGRPKHSYPAIAKALGVADHTTVIHGVRAYAKRMAEDANGAVVDGSNERLSKFTNRSESMGCGGAVTPAAS